MLARSNSPKRRRRMIRIAFGVVAIYLIICTMLVIQERSILYQPRPGPSTPQEIGLKNFTRHELPNPTGEPIVYWESTPNHNAPTLLYFHGNGGGLYMFAQAMAFIADQGFHVVAIEYPGYPGTTGQANQHKLVANAQRLFDHMQSTRPHSPIVLWGYSLGSGVAVQLAASRTANAVVLEAPFTATSDLIAEILPFIPVHLLMRDQFLSRSVIAHINTPLFIMHGEDDFIVPIHHGEALFAAAGEPKTFRHYAHVGHLDLMKTHAYHEAVKFLYGALNRRPHHAG